MDQSSSHLNHQPVDNNPEKLDGVGSPSTVQPDVLIDVGAPLPDYYGENRLVILARDPRCFFSYWEVTQERADTIRQQHGADVWDRAALVLRVYDLTHPEAGTAFFDIEIPKYVRQHYVNVSEGGHTYVVDLGLRLPDGTFISLLHSNKITLPRGRVSDKTDSHWMAVGLNTVEDRREWDKFLSLPNGISSLGKGSVDISKTMAQRWEFLKSVFSGSSSSASSRPWPVPAETVPDDKKHE